MDTMVCIQSISGTGKHPPFSMSFDTDKLMFEFDFFVGHALLDYFHAELTEADEKCLRQAFLDIAGILVRPERFVLNHRDFHSRNILMQDPKQHMLLDFQDARMGLPQYDAVSLLRDSYVTLEEDLVEHLMDCHYRRLCEVGYRRMTWEEYVFFFDMMAFQRNVKALGTFGYQITKRNNRVYERYIRPTVAYLPVYIERREELRKAGELLMGWLGGAL
jgi:aminoglycoside/choline kinase family phosphotransferase